MSKRTTGLSLSKLMVMLSDVSFVLLGIAVTHYIYREIYPRTLSGSHLVKAAFTSAAMVVLVLWLLGAYRQAWPLALRGSCSLR